MGALAYANNVVLVARTTVKHQMLAVCDESKSVVFCLMFSVPKNLGNYRCFGRHFFCRR